MDTWSVIVGFISSLLASFIIWYILNKMLVPRIELSEKIHCMYGLTKNSSLLFKVIVTNLSHRDAFDVNLLGRFILYGVNKQQPEEPYFYVANIGTGKHPYLPGKSHFYEVKKENHRKFKIVPSKKGKTQLAELLNLEEESVNTATILNADARNYLEIVVTCTHSASSSRKITKKVYHCKDIEQLNTNHQNDAEIHVCDITDCNDFDE